MCIILLYHLGYVVIYQFCSGALFHALHWNRKYLFNEKFSTTSPTQSGIMSYLLYFLQVML